MSNSDKTIRQNPLEGQFEPLVTDILLREGGYVNHRNDRGGATNYGITQTTYTSWTSKQGRAWQNVKSITRAEAISVYRDAYWIPSQSGSLPAEIRDIHFDAAVNHGLRRAAKLLQAALQVEQDGAIGPITLAAARTMSPALLRALYLVERYRFYGAIIKRDRSQLVFIVGWMSRMEGFSE